MLTGYFYAFFFFCKTNLVELNQNSTNFNFLTSISLVNAIFFSNYIINRNFLDSLRHN